MKLRVVLLGLALPACGDNVDLPTEEPIAATCDEANLETTLTALPNVLAATETTCGDFVAGEPRCFQLDFEQPIQHATPDGPKFTQKLYLTHRGCDRPTLVIDSGYAQDYFYDDELSLLFRPNTIGIEHRFQGASIPSLADWDWTSLTIENGAADLHAIVGAFRGYYGGRFVSSGASKGGITATYHAYKYPDDLDGSIPYVAPASRKRVDPLYQDYLQAALPQPCSQRVRDVQTAALTTRRAFVVAKLEEQGFGENSELFLEYGTSHLDWGFWQYYGVAFCDQVPTAASSDEAFWQFFGGFNGFISPAAPGVDDTYIYSDSALSYEWLTEHGFALQINAEVAPLLTSPFVLATMEDNFRATFPDVELPAYDGSVTRVAREWVQDVAQNVLLIYGEYDPWSGGAMDQPTRRSSNRFFVPRATHGAQIGRLGFDDYQAAIAIASRLFGEEPDATPLKRSPAADRALLDRQARRDLAIGWRLLRAGASVRGR
jgi:hypothetical protein